MPIPTDTLRNLRRVNVWFAWSALALLVSSVWMVWDDYDRPWREHQREFMQLQAATAEIDYQLTQTDGAKAQRAAARADVDAANEDLATAAEEIRRINDELEALRPDEARLRLEYSNLDADHLVQKDEFEKALTLLGPDAAETQAALAKLNGIKDRLAETKRAQEQVADQRSDLERRLKDIRQPLDDAQRDWSALVRAVEETRQKRDALTSVVQKAILNAPMLDFTAPKGTLGHQEIHQVLLSDVRSEYNFVQSNTADRCATCHKGIDQKDFTRESLIQRFETAVRTVNNKALPYANIDGESVPWSTLSREDQNLWLASQINADDPDVAIESGAVARLRETQRLDTVLEVLLPRVRPLLEREGIHLPEMDRLKPLLGHPKLDLFVGADSPHAMARMGCTVCHEGNGDETDFVFAAHTARDPEELHEWEEKYVPRYGGYDFHTIEHYWDTPMLETKYTSASCAKCHSQVSDVTTYNAQPLDIGQPIAQGRQLFASVGCINCHLVEGLGDSRRVGPDLTNLAYKTTPEFVSEWVHFPGDYRPSTWMPHFFDQENNNAQSATADDPDPVGRTRTEVAAITHYLFEMSRQSHRKADAPSNERWAPTAIPADLRPTDNNERAAAVERGRALFDDVGCLACHGALAHQRYPADPTGQDEWIRAELGRQGRDNAAELAGAMSPVERLAFLRTHYPTLAEQWIVGDLLIREQLGDDEAQSRFEAMSFNDQVLYAVNHFANDATAVFGGPDRVEDQPVFTRFAPELSSIRSKFVDDETALTWLYDWLLEPRHYSDYTKMPSLRLTPGEASDLAHYLATLNVNSEFNQRVAESDMAADESRVDELLMLLLGGQNSEAASRMILEDQGGSLTDQLVAGLRDSFGEAQARAVIEPMSNAEKKMLFLGSKMITHYGCYSCHLIAGFETATRPGTELTYWAEKNLAQLDFAFFSPAFAKETAAKEEFRDLYPPGHAKLERFAHTNPEQTILHNHGSFAWHKMRNPRIWDRGKLKGPYDKLKMPNFFLTDAQADQLVTYLLSRRQPLVTEAVKVAYVDTPKGAVARGRHLTRELNCVGCHRIEDNGAVAHQYFRTFIGGREVFDIENAPPWLRGQGAKVQHEWLFGFLGNVEMLRPWLRVRMPSFHLTHQERQDLVEYFAGVSRYEAKTIHKHINPVRNHLARVHGETVDENWTDMFAPLLPEAGTGADWQKQDLLESSAEFVTGYSSFNQFPADNPNDPFLLPEERDEAYRRILNQTKFTHDLYNVPYPFVAMPTSFGDEDRFRRGEALLFDRGCLACHVLGDPAKRSPGLGPVSAPNLDLAFERLRYDWVLGWMRYPGVIQPRTKMPVLFGEGTAQSTFADVPDPDERQRLEARFGATGDEQIELLVDFLFEAGKRGYDAVETAAGAAAGTHSPPAHGAATTGDE